MTLVLRRVEQVGPNGIKGHRIRNNRCRRGHAVIEVALLAPWIFFMFIGAVDLGFYNYAIISTENAARVAAEYTSASTAKATDSVGACPYVLAELNSMSNVRGLTTCTSLPVTVTATQVAGPDGAQASSVSVTYQTILMFPIPGLAGQFTITRTAEMRLGDS
jgi:Flp pilus assembly protein TadG